jgi:hypothetical protein
MAATRFAAQPQRDCDALGRAVVPDAPQPRPGRTTAGREVDLTRTVAGRTPTEWALLPPTQLLVTCTWLAERAADLHGLYVVRRGAGLRADGTYVGTAVIDRSGRWAPGETVFFDAYD